MITIVATKRKKDIDLVEYNFMKMIYYLNI